MGQRISRGQKTSSVGYSTPPKDMKDIKEDKEVKDENDEDQIAELANDDGVD